jgi:hypothetical protein
VSRQKRKAPSISGYYYTSMLMLVPLCFMMGCGTTNYAGVATSKSLDVEKVKPPPVYSLEKLVSEPLSVDDPNPPSQTEAFLEIETPPTEARIEESENRAFPGTIDERGSKRWHW